MDSDNPEQEQHICFKYCCNCCPDHECDDPLEIDIVGEIIAQANDWFSDDEDIGIRVTKKTRKKMKETRKKKTNDRKKK